MPLPMSVRLPERGRPPADGIPEAGREQHARRSRRE